MISRRPLARGSVNGRGTRPQREPPTAAHMLDVLREDLFAVPRFALFSNVRSATGADVPGLRIADAIAVDTRPGPGLVLHALEVKRDAGDLAREIADLAKGQAIGRFCETFTIIVPAPAKHYLPSRLQLPRTWGLIEVGGCRATRLVYAESVRAEPLPDGFVKALLRSAAAGIARELGELHTEADAPRRAIGGRLDRSWVWFEGCLHRQLVPLAKCSPVSAPCLSCAAKLPPHPDAVAAALDQADAETLDGYRAQIDRLVRARRSA